MDVAAIDIMNYAPYVAPGLSGPEFRYEEFRIMAETTFKVMQTGDGRIHTLWGRTVPADGSIEADPTLFLDDAIARMDKAGIETVVVSTLKMWSPYHHHRLIIDEPVEVVAEAVSRSGGRIIGGAGYNPLRISESLREIEYAVRECGFRYVYFHPMTFGVAANDRRCYPLYAKCVELGVPVGFQVGHSAEVFPSDLGRPMLVDEVAIEFPDLRINLSHTGWPWTGEWCSMLWRHPNVYGDTSAYFPKALDPELLRFLDSSRGRNKVLFGTNGLDPERCTREFLDLPIRDDAKERALRANALEFLGL
ncbi:MAG: amidohydrolase family protein [Acidimicrobiia bacterium]